MSADNTPERIKTSGIDALSAITTRASIRQYTPEPIAQTVVDTLLYAGFCAPSADNYRPWHFIVVKNPHLLKSLGNGANRYAKMAEQAQLAIIVCGDATVQDDEEFLIEDCSAAAQNILLAAHALGLGAVWCGVHWRGKWSGEIVDLLRIPDKIHPVCVIPIGHPDEERPPRERYESGKVHTDNW